MASSLAERAGSSIYITEKCEGTSATFVYRRGGNWLAKLLKKDGSFQICSRNTIVFNSQTGKEAPHFLRDVAKKYDLQNKMKSMGRTFAIQGEVLGPKIQGNIYKLPELELRVFAIFDIEAQEYLDYYGMISIASKLGLTTVPVLQVNIGLVNDVKYWVEYSKGKSQVNANILREGVVIRSMNDNFSFKSINPEYLLKQE
jgi:ATP-dependent RNA circularization protein (DNA/RNA ligase family)